MKKVLAVLVALVLVACAVAYAQSPVLNYGVDGSGGLTRQLVSGTGATETAPRAAYAVQFSALDYPVASTTSPCVQPCVPDPGDSSYTIPFGPVDLSTYPNVAITLHNKGPHPLQNVVIEWSPDNSKWEKWDYTTFANLASGASKSMQISGNSRRYLRVEARVEDGLAETVLSTFVDVQGY